ncbi:hypothetical protein B0H14DRAFT_2567924 [Mycena olivaceomarginata]|nr:hypothetical protein B0H14DRAFT_2567924 [Mycena olivaceomarginata]
MLPSYFLPPPSLRTRTLPNLAAVAAVLHHSDLDTVHRLQFPHLPIAGPFRSIYSAVETQFSVVADYQRRILLRGGNTVKHVATTFGLAYTEALGPRRASGRIPLPSPLRPDLGEAKRHPKFHPRPSVVLRIVEAKHIKHAIRDSHRARREDNRLPRHHSNGLLIPAARHSCEAVLWGAAEGGRGGGGGEGGGGGGGI